MNLTLLLWLAILVLMLPTIPLLWFVSREIRKTRQLFRKLAIQKNGTVTLLAFGLRYERHHLQIRVYAQGGIQYRAGVRLRADPGILVTRKFSRLKFLDSLNYSPSRQPFLFRTAIDDEYGFRAKDTRWMRELFTRGLLDRLGMTDRVRRIQISKRLLRGSILLYGNSGQEHDKVSQAVDILDELLLQLSRSSLSP